MKYENFECSLNMILYITNYCCLSKFLSLEHRIMLDTKNTMKSENFECSLNMIIYISVICTLFCGKPVNINDYIYHIDRAGKHWIYDSHKSVRFHFTRYETIPYFPHDLKSPYSDL